MAERAWSDDWPQWRGENRDGVWREKGILDRIPAAGLKIRWRTRISQGYSGPVVAAGKVYVSDRLSNPDRERILCLDEKTGKILWEFSYLCEYAEMEYGNGPRASPTVDGDKVYILGTKGHLYCLRIDTGEVIWGKDLVKEYNAVVPRYGMSAAPLVEGGLLIVCAGGRPEGTVMAFDKHTGEERWKVLKDRPAYSAPIMLDQGGSRQLIAWTAEHVWSLSPENGSAYWKIPYKCTFDDAQVISSPVLQGDRLLCLAAWGRGSFLLELDREKPAVKEVWRTRRSPSTTMSTPVFPDRKYFYAMLNNGNFACLDAANGKEVWATDKVTGLRNGSAHITPNGERAFLFNQRGQLILVKLSPEEYKELGRCLLIEPTAGYRPQGPVTWAHPAYANRNIYARNDKELICASLAVEDSLEDLTRGEGPEADEKFGQAFEANDPTQVLALSPDGKWLAGGTWTGAIRMVNWQTAEVIPAPAKHRRTITALSFSSDSKLLVSAGGNAFYSAGNNYKKDAEIRVWDVAAGKGLGKLEGHSDKVLAAAIAPDSVTVASGAMDDTVRLWDVKSMKQRHLLAGHEDAVTSLAFSPDGKILTSADMKGIVRIWDVSSGKELTSFKGHDEAIMCLAFSPDGLMLATGGADWKIHLWDPQSRKQTGSLKGHRGTIYSMAFSPDGSSLASGSGDETIRLWDMTGRTEKLILRGHESGVTSVVFSPDGKSLASAGRDDGVKLWPVTGSE